MPVSVIISKRGKGKTLLTVNYAKIYRELYPLNPIYANLHLFGLDPFIYSPAMFFPYDSVENALIIIDDIKAIRNIEGLLLIISNSSRKSNLDLLLTGQYYTMAKKEMRESCEKMIEVEYDKTRDLLQVAIEEDGIITFEEISNAVEKVCNNYDTNEIVHFITEDAIEGEILKHSKSIEDLALNCEIAVANKRDRRTLFKKLSAKFQEEKAKRK